MLLSKSLADVLARVEPSVSLTFRPLAEQFDALFVRERLVAVLSAFFGGLALLMAAIGLYGVTAYAVSCRRTEIGVRMALGADAGRVVRLVLGRVAWLVGAGVARRPGDQPVGLPVRQQSPLRARGDRRHHTDRCGRGARDGRGARGLAAGAARRTHRSRGGAAQRVN